MTPPSVTVGIPVLDEEAHIEDCLAAVSSQTYPGLVEILVADGGSRDRTRELAARFPMVRVIDNPRRHQAAGLNEALRQARGDVFVRVDGHCVIAPDYVARCVEALDATGAAMVGGAMTPVAGGGFQAAVAAAMRSRLGVGTARFHRADAPAGWVDTVYLGAFPVELALRAGGYDEAFVTNQDAEFAWRMRPLGGVWFEPAIRSTYRPRASARSLARQFFRYGRGRASTAVTHPRSLSPRQLAAPALVLGLLTPWRSTAATGYLAVLGATLLASRRLPLRVAARVPVAVVTMHLAWGLGFLVSLPRAVQARLSAGRHA